MDYVIVFIILVIDNVRKLIFSQHATNPVKHLATQLLPQVVRTVSQGGDSVVIKDVQVIITN